MSNQRGYEIIQIDSASWRFEDNGVRAFLFAGREKALLVDTGFGGGDIQKAAHGLTNRPIMLVNTHADRDHTGSNALFAEAYMHPSEFDRCRRTAGGDFALRPLWEGHEIDIGGRCFEVILIPGHTPGSIALLDARNRVLVSGDSVQAGLIFMSGPGRSLDAYIAGLEKLTALRNRFDTVYPSHGPFPVGADILDALADGSRRLRNGELEGADAPFDTSAKRYNAGAAQFLYEPIL